MPKLTHQLTGFTLIELILYVALVSIFISGAIRFAWDLIYSGVKSDIEREVNYNLRLASSRLALEMRNASAVNSLGSSDLCLASHDTSHNPTRFYLSEGRLRVGWGGGSSDCSGLTNDQPLTDNRVTVSSLNFVDQSNDNLANVGYTLTIVADSDRSEWQKTQTYSSSIELRISQ